MNLGSLRADRISLDRTSSGAKVVAEWYHERIVLQDRKYIRGRPMNKRNSNFMAALLLILGLPGITFGQGKAAAKADETPAGTAAKLVSLEQAPTQDLSAALFGQAGGNGLAVFRYPLANLASLQAGKLDYVVPFSVLFKYDTSPDNPEHKCYDIRKPLTAKHTFLFNFLSKQQYNIGDVANAK